MEELKQTKIFGTLGEEDLKVISGYFTEEFYSKKDLIFHEGDPSDWLYLVIDGKVKITKISQEGKEIILELISPPDVFGAVAVMRGFPYPANAVAMEESRVLKISRSNLMNIVDTYPTVMYCLMQDMGDRMRGSHDMLKNIALEKVSSRIASLLLKLAEKLGSETPDGTAIDLKLTKQDIADMVGTTVETSIRTMSHFKRQGLIVEADGRIVIKDREGLEAIGY